MHNEKSELAGKKVKIKDETSELGGQEILIEDWGDNVSGQSWMTCNAPVCINYAIRTGMSPVPVLINNEVLYGKINGSGYLVHISELNHD